MNWERVAGSETDDRSAKSQTPWLRIPNVVVAHLATLHSTSIQETFFNMDGQKCQEEKKSAGRETCGLRSELALVGRSKAVHVSADSLRLVSSMKLSYSSTRERSDTLGTERWTFETRTHEVRLVP